MATQREDKDKKDAPEFLYVRSNLDGNEVALHEVDPAHPGGSVLVAGTNVEKVGDTPFVRSRLRDRWLVEAKGDRKGDRKGADERAKAREGMLSAELAVTGEAPERDEADGTGVPDERNWTEADDAVDSGDPVPAATVQG